MKKIYILLFVFSMLAGTNGFAQQQYHLSQYFQHPQALNPALSGIDDFWKINAGYRKQWMGIEHAPQVYFLSFNGVFKKPDIRLNSLRISRPEAYEEQETDEAYRSRNRKHGLGGFISQNEMGHLRITSGLLSYAYHIPLTRSLNMSVGLAAAYSSNAFLPRNYHVRQEDDARYLDLMRGSVNQSYFDVNAGAMLYGKQFYFGYSATQLVLVNATSAEEFADPTTYVNHYAMLGYQLDLSRKVKLQPSILVRYDRLQEAHFDANLKLRFDDLVWAGVSYRNKEAMAAMFGLVLNRDVTLGYAYEQSVGEFNMHNNGTHEVVLGLRLGNRYNKTPYFW
jgi:type IX secretion system PorP/SprF family membrane protein